jgi:type I restriction enzyme S subunit
MSEQLAQQSFASSGLFKNIPNDWRLVRFPEVVYFQEGPGIRNWQYRTSGIPFVNIRCLVNGRLDVASMNCLDPEEVARKYRHFLLDPEDFVVLSSGTIGRIAEVRAEDLPCMLNTSVIRMRPRSSSLDRRFLRYFLSSTLFQRQIESFAAGSVQVNYGPTHLKQMWIVVPPLSQQQGIAEVLGALDDKIDCNDLLRRTLGQLSSALLSDLLMWADGESVLAEGHLSDIAAVNTRTLKPGIGTIRYLDISSVGVGEGQEPTIVHWADAPGRARRGVADGDVLWSTVRPNRKSHCLLLDPPDDLVVSTGFAVLTPTTVGASFLYGITERPQFVEYLVAVAEGSAYPAVRGDRFLLAPVALPPTEAIARYEEQTMPLRRCAHAAGQESRILSRMRDTLLPPLLSGELPVRDAEPLVGNAV